jgi:alanine racemase
MRHPYGNEEKLSMERSLLYAKIDLGAIASNVRELRRIANPSARLMAVVKANGYGHGANEVAGAALENGADVLGVARLCEAVALREAGFSAPVQIFGYTPAGQAETLLRYGLTQTVFSLEEASGLSRVAVAKGGRIKVHVKIDTGMGRLGLVTDCGEISGAAAGLLRNSLEQVEAIVRLPGIEPEGVMTHFASSDSADKTYAKKQFEIFVDFIGRLSKRGIEFPVRHAANSGALIDMPETHLDLVRPGISIYGFYPSDEIDRSKIELKPAMTLTSRVAYAKKVPAGFSVSYGQTHKTRTSTTIATVPVGYADGYSRLLSSRGYMLVRGQRAPIVGRVCMDLTMLDVGHIPGVAVDDEVVVIGRQGDKSIHADEIAKMTDTINYEVVSSITARVARIYHS